MHHLQETYFPHQATHPTSSHSGSGASTYLQASYPHQAFTSAPSPQRSTYLPHPLHSRPHPPPPHSFDSGGPAYPSFREDTSMHHTLGPSYPALLPAHISSNVTRPTLSAPSHPPHWHHCHAESAIELVSLQRAMDPSPAVGSALISPSLTYIGHIKTSADAILLLAACDLSADASAAEASSSSTGRGSMSMPSPPPRRIQRRLLETERAELVKSGSVFVWDEEEAGMRRWTDGRCWSASRVSGCFLTYRELEARKRSANDLAGPRANQYKVEGLIKQSFSMTTTSGRKMHIVSYYTKRDIREGRLRRVSEDPRFVGEAGGEWGLRIDEHEFPDPINVNPAQQDEESTSENSRPSKTDDDACEAQSTVAASPPTTQLSLADGKHQALSSGFNSIPAKSFVSPSRHSLKRPAQDSVEERKEILVRAGPDRPALKRLRSSSASGGVHSREGATHSSNMLTESNMRTAGLETAQGQELRQYEQKPLLHLTRPRQQQHAMSLTSDKNPTGKRTYEAAEQQDGRSAAGALLSLRSFFLPAPSPIESTNGPVRPEMGSRSSMSGESSFASAVNSTSRGGHLPRRSYIDSGHESSSTVTPLTTPDYSSGDKSFSPINKKKPSSASVHVARRRSEGGIPAGDRSDSDRDTLKRLNVRV